MRKPYVNFRELKAAVPIRRVLEKYGHLKSLAKSGDRLSGPCLLCDSQSAFRVSQEKNCFMCFRCQIGGNMLDLVAAMEQCSVRDAAVKVAEWFEIETSGPAKSPARKSARVPRREGDSRAAKPAEKPPVAADQVTTESRELEPDTGAKPSSINPALTFELKLQPEHPWFTKVGLTPDTVREFGLGLCSKGMMGGRIAFPIRNAQGELIGYAGRWPGEDPPEGQPLWRYPKGLDLDQLVYPAERLAAADLSRALFARDPLQVLLCLQMGLGDVFFVPVETSMKVH